MYPPKGPEEEREKKYFLSLSEDEIDKLDLNDRIKYGRYAHLERNKHRDITPLQSAPKQLSFGSGSTMSDKIRLPFLARGTHSAPISETQNARAVTSDAGTQTVTCDTNDSHDQSMNGHPMSENTSDSISVAGRGSILSQNDDSIRPSQIDQPGHDNESQPVVNRQPSFAKGKQPTFHSDQPDDGSSIPNNAMDVEEDEERLVQVAPKQQFAMEQQSAHNQRADLDARKRPPTSPLSGGLPAFKKLSVNYGEGPSRTARSSLTESSPANSTRADSMDTVTDTAFARVEDITNPPQEPKWYKDVKTINARPRKGSASYPSTIDNKFSELRSAIDRCEKAAAQGQPLSDANLIQVNDSLHQAFFVEFTNETAAKTAIRKNRLMHNDSGLPRLFTPGQVEYPYHIVADAKELYTKWWRGVFDTSLYRGIIIGTKKNDKVNRAGSSNRLDPNYPGRREGKYFGNGHLLNGQWWPHQLCALRDGAHNSSQGGIAGTDQGAWSIILGADPKYPDVDDGDNIQYCGTEGTPGSPTTSTNYMKASLKTGNPVRVIRSENCKNALYRPAKGYRYDGLYRVVGEQLVKPAKELWRFRMVRLPDQDPIRFEGLSVRPTSEELDKLEKSKAEREFLVAGQDRSAD